MSSYVGAGEYKEDRIKEKDFYARRRGIVPKTELFEEKRQLSAMQELTSLEIEKLENYACKLLLVG